MQFAFTQSLELSCYKIKMHIDEGYKWRCSGQSINIKCITIFELISNWVHYILVDAQQISSIIMCYRLNHLHFGYSVHHHNQSEFRDAETFCQEEE